MIHLDKRERARRRLLPAVGLVCEIYGVPPDRVMSDSRHRVVSLARAIICYLGDQVLFMEKTEIARALGVSRDLVVKAIQRIEDNYQDRLRPAKRAAMMLRARTQGVAVEEAV